MIARQALKNSHKIPNSLLTHYASVFHNKQKNSIALALLGAHPRPKCARAETSAGFSPRRCRHCRHCRRVGLFFVRTSTAILTVTRASFAPRFKRGNTKRPFPNFPPPALCGATVQNQLLVSPRCLASRRAGRAGGPAGLPRPGRHRPEFIGRRRPCPRRRQRRRTQTPHRRRNHPRRRPTRPPLRTRPQGLWPSRPPHHQRPPRSHKRRITPPPG